MATPTEIVLEYVCPSLGMVVANLMFMAPLRDLQSAVTKGEGLGDLNPTPWAFMLGNCLGWTTYGVLTFNWFIFWANYPGFLIACWLNLGAVKLLYSSHHQEGARRSLVDFLSSSEAVAKAMEQSSSLVERRTSQPQLLLQQDTNNKGLEKESLLYNTNINSEIIGDGDLANIADTTSATVEYGYGTSVTNNSSPSANSTLDNTDTTNNTEQQHREEEEEQQQQNQHNFAKIVWNVTSQSTPAKTPHDRLVVGIIIVWSVVLSTIGFYEHYAPISVSNSSDAETVSQSIVGYVVNLNLIFFYGAPLSKIQTVLKTKRSNTLHLPTMAMNTSNAVFWTAYALAPQVNDYFISIPNGLGVVLGTIQFLLWIVFPRTTTKDDEEEASSGKQNQIEIGSCDGKNEAVSNVEDTTISMVASA